MNSHPPKSGKWQGEKKGRIGGEWVESGGAVKEKRGIGGEWWGSGDLALARLFPLLPVPLVLLPSANGGKADTNKRLRDFGEIKRDVRRLQPIQRISFQGRGGALSRLSQQTTLWTLMSCLHR